MSKLRSLVLLVCLALSAGAAEAETRIRAYLTAYTYWDNTPPGSAEISHPVAHQRAGGRGTFTDTGEDVLDYPAGTVIYVPDLARYFVVEDTCGDGPRPENGPWHRNVDEPGVLQFDMWIGGKGGSTAAANACAYGVTKVYDIVLDAKRGYPVRTGEIFATEC
jgi:hypothetical protein